MFPFSRKRNKNNPTPTWLMWLVVAFIAYTMLTSNNRKSTAPVQIDKENSTISTTEPVREEPSLGSIIDPKKLINIDSLKGKFLPQTIIKLSVKDTSQGDGEFAICGQKVTISYSSFTEEKKEVESEQKITFQIGEGKVMPALERGVVGMKKNGARTITSPGNMAYGVEKFTRNDVPALANINFEVKMLDISPKLPEIGAYRVLGDGYGQGKIYTCGSEAKVHVSIWDVEGKKLYNSRDNNGNPLTFTIGKSEVFLGLEQGMLEMSEGMHRNLIVPPSFQRTLQGKAPTINFPLPKNQTILVDIESVP